MPGDGKLDNEFENIETPERSHKSQRGATSQEKPGTEKSEPSISDASPDPDDDVDAKSTKANDQRDPDTRLAAAETANAEMRAKRPRWSSNSSR